MVIDLLYTLALFSKASVDFGKATGGGPNL
jgi:hypothetical protein